MNKYMDKGALAFGVGAIIGGIVFNMVIVNKLPKSFGGNA